MNSVRNIESITSWFAEHVTDKNGNEYRLDQEQAAAVCDAHKNTLVSARAGTGKTHTLVAKIIYLIGHDRLRPEQIMAFVFNRKAAIEINERLTGILVDGKPIVEEGAEVARTFHGFAHYIVRSVDGRGSFGKILLDGERKADTDRSRTLFIQAVLDRLKATDKELMNDVYLYFRKESTTIDKSVYDTPEEYYQLIRNHQYRTLDGQTVASFSEKIIADFLFEHGVSYRYEPEYYPESFARKGLAKPEHEDKLRRHDVIKGDFILPNAGVVWEHWAIRGDESFDEISRLNESGAIGDYEEYRAKKEWKRWFYSRVWAKDPRSSKNWYRQDFTRLVESYRAPDQSREDFEEKIQETCLKNGIRFKKLSHEELVRRAWRKQIKYFTTMVTQFIDRTQQQFFDSIPKLEEIIDAEREEEEGQIRVKKFHKVALKAYKEYIRCLEARGTRELSYINSDNEQKRFIGYGTDFSMLLQRSLAILNRREANELLEKNNVAYILVDEYQDFSRLFYENLVGLLKIFPNAKLFCVGDDWQAINRFAGSDDEFFSNFSEMFSEDTCEMLISRNYRSCPEIVDNANAVMKQLVDVDTKGFAKANNQKYGDALIKTIDLRDFRTTLPAEDARQNSNLQKYIERISELIIKHYRDGNVLVLHRRNEMLFGVNVWGVVKHMVRNWVTNEIGAMTKMRFDEVVDFGEGIDTMTAHRAKGLQATTVILLEVDPKVFPSDSHNAELFHIFGDNAKTYIKDEARLYYVALTRAKANLYVLWGTYKHSDGSVPDYISAISETAENR